MKNTPFPCPLKEVLTSKSGCLVLLNTGVNYLQWQEWTPKALFKILFSALSLPLHVNALALSIQSKHPCDALGKRVSAPTLLCADLLFKLYLCQLQGVT